MVARSHVLFRLVIGGFAAILVVQAAWLLAVEFVRPSLPYFPVDQASIDVASAKRAQAGMAARLGLVRGELWADYATALGVQAASEESVKDTEQVALRAVRLAPSDARGWLLLAAAAARTNRANRDVIELLKMSYYTGPDEPALMPLRVRVATRSDVIADEDLQVLVAEDIRAIAMRHPELKPALAAAYRSAVPAGKQFIDGTLEKIDPAFLASLRGSGPAK